MTWLRYVTRKPVIPEESLRMCPSAKMLYHAAQDYLASSVDAILLGHYTSGLSKHNDSLTLAVTWCTPTLRGGNSLFYAIKEGNLHLWKTAYAKHWQMMPTLCAFWLTGTKSHLPVNTCCQMIDILNSLQCCHLLQFVVITSFGISFLKGNSILVGVV